MALPDNSLHLDAAVGIIGLIVTGKIPVIVMLFDHDLPCRIV